MTAYRDSTYVPLHLVALMGAQALQLGCGRETAEMLLEVLRAADARAADPDLGVAAALSAARESARKGLRGCVP